MSTHRGVLMAVSACAPLAWIVDAAGFPGLAGALVLTFASLAPGLALLGILSLGILSRREVDPIGWHLALGLGISPVLLTIATVLLVFTADLPLAQASTLSFRMFFAAAALLLLRRPSMPVAEPAPGWRYALLAVTPALGLVIAAGVTQIPEGMRVSYHGLFHADVVAQIVAGILPPENPAMAGDTLRYYWLFHWLLAIHSELTGFSILATAPWIGLVSLLMFVAAAHNLLLRFLPPGLAAIGAPAVGFTMNLLFPVFFGVGVLATGWPEGGTFWPFQLFGIALPAGDPRLLTLLGKFLNLNGFPLGVALFAALVVEMVPGQGRRPRLAIVFILLTGTLFFHSAAAVAAYAALSLAYFATSVDDWSTTRPAQLIGANLAMGATFVAALVVAGPYLAITLWQPGGLSSEGSAFSKNLMYNVGGLLSAATPLLPIALIAFSWRRVGATSRFLIVATSVLVAIGTLLVLPDGNQYKLLQLASFPAGALLFWTLRGAEWRGAIFTAVCVLAVSSHAITFYGYAQSGMATRDSYSGDGGFLRAPGAPPLDRALQWIRGNTPSEAVVVQRPVRRGNSPVTPVSGRGVFVLHTLGHFQGPGYNERLIATTRLYRPTTFAANEVKQIQSLLDRPLYVLLVRKDEPEMYDTLVEKFGGAPEALEAVFWDQDARVYAVRRP